MTSNNFIDSVVPVHTDINIYDGGNDLIKTSTTSKVALLRLENVDLYIFNSHERFMLKDNTNSTYIFIYHRFFRFSSVIW